MNTCNIQLSFSSLRTICFLEHIAQNRITGPRDTNLWDCGHKLPNNVPKGLLPTYSATSSECFSVSRQPTIWALGFPFVFIDLIGEKYTFVTFEYAFSFAYEWGWTFFHAFVHSVIQRAYLLPFYLLENSFNQQLWSNYHRPGKCQALQPLWALRMIWKLTILSNAPQTFPGVFSFHYFPQLSWGLMNKNCTYFWR